MVAPAAGDQLTPTALRALAAALFSDWAGTNNVATQQSRSNNAFGDLSTVGPTVTITSQGTWALVLWSCIIFGSSAAASGRMTVEISGQTTLTASTSNGIFAAESGGLGIGGSGLQGGLYPINPGSNTYRGKYNNISANGTSFFQDRRLIVIAP
jgi:hypothetical protein